MKIPAPGVLFAAVNLYLGAFAWAVLRTPDSLLVGLLTGSGSIMLGVWLGLAVSERHYPQSSPPPPPPPPPPIAGTTPPLPPT